MNGRVYEHIGKNRPDYDEKIDSENAVEACGKRGALDRQDCCGKGNEGVVRKERNKVGEVDVALGDFCKSAV